MNTYCNPLDLPYRYQHMNEQGRRYAFREGADPTLVYFKGTYYLFVSMSAGFFYSDDLLHWDFHADPDLEIYDYAPDVREIDGYLYFCASSRSKPCPILRSADPLHEKFEAVAAPFPFWDPDLFLDDDGRLYLYWGCTNTQPIWGVELDRETLAPLGEKTALIHGDPEHLGYERPGENGVVDKESSVMYRSLAPLFDPETKTLKLPAGVTDLGGYPVEALTKIFLAVGQPYLEGAYMTKHAGRYYLQYACPGTQYNIYADGVYVGEGPLGPFVRQASNPFSAVPGGFATGAGHGSTVADKYGNYWHAATMRISVNHDFERRVGLFPAGFDADGVLYCNQNFADYPHRIPAGKFDPAAWQPEWMLLSYGKRAFASSTAAGSDPARAVDENIRTWWSAADAAPGQWLAVDLGRDMDIRAVQVNLADEGVAVEFPPESYGDDRHTRHIELEAQISHYTLETSADGAHWTVLETVARECSNGYYEVENGVTARFVRVVGGALPYGQALRVAGLRVFGHGGGAKPAAANARAERLGDLDARVCWDAIPDAQGCNVRYGIAPDKLYHSHLVYGQNEVTLCTLTAGQAVYTAVDAFNENGVTPGEVFKL